MVKRGIGAVVLAIIAALLLGWLLKDKSQERQELVDIKMPNASEMNIPSLTDAVDKVTDSATNLVEGAKEKVSQAGDSVASAASGAVDSMKSTASEATKTISDNIESSDSPSVSSNSKKPGFSIRPSQQNETKEIIDNVNNNTANVAVDEKAKTTKTAGETTTTTATTNTVVASTKKLANFAPKIIEKKKTVKNNTKISPVKKKTVKKVAPKPANTQTTANIAGQYSIQLLATSSNTRAQKLANVMTSEGYSSSITQTNRNGKLLYRVRVGGYIDRSKAIKAQEGMKRRYQKNFFVQNSLVVSD